MKFLITENQKEKTILKWMDNKFNPELLDKEYEHPEFDNCVVYKKDGKVIMIQDNDDKVFWFDYEVFYDFLHKIISLEYKEFEIIAKKWLNNTFDLKNYKIAGGIDLDDY